MTSPAKSPYKKIPAVKKCYVRFMSVGALEQNKAYKMYDITPSQHDQYGPGQLAFLINAKKEKIRVQLPTKFLKHLDIPEDINVFLNDMKQNKHPFLVYRQTLPDKSFDIDILPSSDEMLQLYSKWSNVPVLNDSSDDGTPEPSSSKTSDVNSGSPKLQDTPKRKILADNSDDNVNKRMKVNEVEVGDDVIKG